MIIALILVLATWRVTALLVYEDGPFMMFKNLRDIVGAGLMDDGDHPLTQLGGLFSCFWCMSVWVAAGLVTVAAPLLPALCFSWAGVIYYVLSVFAVSGGVVVLEHRIVRRRR